MKNLIFAGIFFITLLSFGQGKASLRGVLTDLESNNNPLVYAKVIVKEMGVETLSDENGIFEFKNLEAGHYTLVYSFVGYETKETKVNVELKKYNYIDLTLGASTVSLEELMQALANNEH